MENKLAHLQMLQAIIGRMASNSFMLKGWSVTLVSALFALAADKANPLFIYLAYFPAAMFWILDGYFLRQERLFRALYDEVRGQTETTINFSMDTTAISKNVNIWLCTCFSTTLLLFHGAVLATILIIMFLVEAPH